MEQRKIAHALSDVDVLIVALGRLIAKTRDLKQAAVQQLLLGRTRLPGFAREWQTRRVGDLLTIRHGKSQREVGTSDGPYPILASGGKIGSAHRYLHARPCVLIGRKGTIDEPQYMDSPFWAVDTLFYSEIKDENCAKSILLSVLPHRLATVQRGIRCTKPQFKNHRKH
jgi:type I restriction enzyme S subunit